jgi:hypothetical protein
MFTFAAAGCDCVNPRCCCCCCWRRRWRHCGRDDVDVEESRDREWRIERDIVGILFVVCFSRCGEGFSPGLGLFEGCCDDLNGWTFGYQKTNWKCFGSLGSSRTSQAQEPPISPIVKEHDEVPTSIKMISFILLRFIMKTQVYHHSRLKRSINKPQEVDSKYIRTFYIYK